MNLGSLINRHARYRPDHPAVVFQDRRLTYLQFNQEINRLANALAALGLGKGHKIATVLPNRLELLEVFFATAKIGAVVVPLSTLLRAQAVATLLKDSDSVMLITETRFVSLIDEIKSQLPGIDHDRYLLCGPEDLSGYRNYHKLKAAAGEEEPGRIELGFDDPYDIMYSSGTTATPRFSFLGLGILGPPDNGCEIRAVLGPWLRTRVDVQDPGRFLSSRSRQ